MCVGGEGITKQEERELREEYKDIKTNPFLEEEGVENIIITKNKKKSEKRQSMGEEKKGAKNGVKK